MSKIPLPVGTLYENFLQILMYKILVTITCIVVLTIHWDEFTNKIDLAKILQVSKNIMVEVKE